MQIVYEGIKRRVGNLFLGLPTRKRHDEVRMLLDAIRVGTKNVPTLPGCASSQATEVRCYDARTDPVFA